MTARGWVERYGFWLRSGFQIPAFAGMTAWGRREWWRGGGAAWAPAFAGDTGGCGARQMCG